MPAPIGLYYPYIHFRDEGWLKAAALYWPALARIVPLGYPTHDSDPVRTLRDELDFVLDVRPGYREKHDTAVRFRHLVEKHAAELRAGVAAAPAEVRWEGISAHDGPPGIAYIHASKMADDLRRVLEGKRLLAGTDDPAPPRGPEWVGMDARLGAVYMCALAEEMAGRSGLLPTTDQIELHAAYGWTAERLSRAILGGPASDGEAPTSADGLTTRIAFLALDLVVPADLNAVPVKRIVAIRKKYDAELAEFQAAVDAVAAELSTLGEIDAVVLDHYVRQSVTRAFAKPMRDLEKALRGLRVPTARAVIGTRFELPAALTTASAAHVHPVLSAGVGAAVGVFNVRADLVTRRGELRTANPVGAYLFDVECGLTADGVLDRTAQVIRRMSTRRSRAARP